MRATIASASSPGTRRRPVARSPSSSSTSGVVNCMSCSARKAASPSAGSSIRAATTARQAREVAATWCLGCVWNGIPYWRKLR